jgi:EmrB/QacA subfamily drug resistance transporter
VQRQQLSTRPSQLALIVLSTAQLLVVLGDSVVNISLPTAALALHISTAARQWAVTAYIIPFGGLLLISGRIADSAGHKRSLVVGLGGFAAASVVAGVAPDAGTFFAGRAAQGVFAALLTPSVLSLLSMIYTGARERARAFGVYGAVSGLGAALGVAVGGLLTEFASWRWSLLLNAPVAVAVAVLAAWAVPPDQARTRGRGYDAAGAVLVTTGLMVVVWGLASAAESRYGWTSPASIGLLAAGVVLLAAFVAVEARGRSPLVPASVVLDRTRGWVLVSAALVNAGLFAVFLFLAFYLQDEMGMSPLVAGIAFLPFSIAIMATATAVPRIAPTWPARSSLSAGALTATAGLIYLAVAIRSTSGYVDTALPGELLIGIGMGLVFVGQPTLVMHGVPAASVGVTSALLNTAQQMGGAIGTAVLNTVFASAVTASGGLAGTLHGYHVTFFAAAACLFAASAIVAILTSRTRDDITEGSTP